MPSYKLTYFDIDGGRAEPLRIALHAAGIAFEDQRISFSEFGEVRKTTPFSSVPVLDIDGTVVTQSNSLSRYIGKLANLYPTDDLQALYCDEVMASLEDLTHYIVRSFGLKGEELRAAREKLVDGWLTVYLRGLDGLLTRGGGEFFADNRLTVADLRSFVQVRALCSGHLDHIPADIVQRIAPNLVEHKNRIAEEPTVAAYYASRA